MASDANEAFGELTDTTAVHTAVKESTAPDGGIRTGSHGVGDSARLYAIVADRLWNPLALVSRAFLIQHPDRLVPPSSTVQDACAALQRLDFEVVDSAAPNADTERAWRYAVQRDIDVTAAGTGDGHVSAGLLRALGAYGGAQGIWLDKQRTRSLVPNGVAVAVAHTGMHYADDFSESTVLYHYPTTSRPSGRDASEVDAMKAAARLALPIFVITRPAPRSSRRLVRLAWITGWDDPARIFHLEFGSQPPVSIVTEDSSDEEPFALRGNRSRTTSKQTRYRPDQPTFKFNVIKRYGARCPLSGIAVHEMLDAAHLVPDSDDGTYDPRNGLPLTASLHRAFDADLFAIHPDTREVVTRPQGPTPHDMGIHYDDLGLLERKPHQEALRWRYERFLSKIGSHEKPVLSTQSRPDDCGS